MASVIRSSASRKASARSKSSTISRSSSARARRSASWGRTAPARPRCSTSSPATCSPRRARSISATARHTRMPAHRRCRLGIGRSYQIPQPFGGMTVFENLLVGAAFGSNKREKDCYDRCISVLGDRAPGQGQFAGRPSDPARAQAPGMARALATDPRSCCSTRSPAASPKANAGSSSRRSRASARAGTSIIWIEHIVHALLAVADRIVVLQFRQACWPKASRTRDASTPGRRGLHGDRGR